MDKPMQVHRSSGCGCAAPQWTTISNASPMPIFWKTALKISYNAFGELTYSDGGAAEPVVPVRAFPMSAPDTGISLVDVRGHELVWIADIHELDTELRTTLLAALADSEFMPEIKAIIEVSSYTMPSQWKVGTDRGETLLTLKGEEDIRRLSPTRLLIAAGNGVQFLIRDRQQLDKASRKHLDRFL